MGVEGSQTKAKLTEVKLEFIDATGDTKAYIGLDPIDNVYKLFIIKGHIDNELEHGDHWSVVTSGEQNQHRFTLRWRG